MSHPSPECVRANAMLLDLIYGELDGPVRTEVETHAVGCTRCTADLAAMRSTRQLMSTLEPEPAPEAGMASLLAYAQQQAQREAAPAPRPAWRRWLLGAVPVAAVALLGVSVALESSRTHPTSSLSAREERALPEAEQGAVMAAAPEPQASPKRDSIAAPAAAPPPAPAEPASPHVEKDKLAAKEPARSPVAHREEAPTRAAGQLSLGSANAFGGLGGAGAPAKSAMKPVTRGGGAVANKKVVSALQAPAQEGYRAADRADADARDDASPPPAVASAKEKEEAPSGPLAGADLSLDKGAPAASPAPIATAAPGRPASRAKASGRISSAADAESAGNAPDDGLGEAEAQRRSGNHAAAAEAYLHVFETLLTGSRAELALYNAALEDRAAGKLARSAEELERYARLFPRSSRAPTALAVAAEILRSREGEGAATRLESDLLERYPASAEASGLRARSQGPLESKRSKSAAPAAASAPAGASGATSVDAPPAHR